MLLLPVAFLMRRITAVRREENIWYQANQKTRDHAFSPREIAPSLLDLVFATEHVVDVSEVVGTRKDSIDFSCWSEVLLEMCLLTKVAHLIVHLWFHDPPRV